MVHRQSARRSIVAEPELLVAIDRIFRRACLLIAAVSEVGGPLRPFPDIFDARSNLLDESLLSRQRHPSLSLFGRVALITSEFLFLDLLRFDL